MRRILAALGIGAASMASAQDGYYGKYETPSYSVEQVIGEAEVRRYEPHLLAVVSVRGDQRGALNQGFRALAGYIFGGNEGSASVAMTSPVTMQPEQIAMTSPVTQTQEDGIWTVTFMMPSQYTRDTLPTPNNAAVRFIEVPAQRMVVLTFSGRGTVSAMEEQTARLTQIAQNAGLATQGAPVYMYYDDPFTAPWNRRNEVGFELR